MKVVTEGREKPLRGWDRSACAVVETGTSTQQDCTGQIQLYRT